MQVVLLITFSHAANYLAYLQLNTWPLYAPCVWSFTYSNNFLLLVKGMSVCLLYNDLWKQCGVEFVMTADLQSSLQVFKQMLFIVAYVYIQTTAKLHVVV